MMNYKGRIMFLSVRQYHINIKKENLKLIEVPVFSIYFFVSYHYYHFKMESKALSIPRKPSKINGFRI